ncbi:hypothetical protein HanHA89_Chr12g0463321 [Helianthus annuus]|nr:hypothetical protein HanHA89_Chr12g0463321 [Helianthus annuus]
MVIATLTMLWLDNKMELLMYSFYLFVLNMMLSGKKQLLHFGIYRMMPETENGLRYMAVLKPWREQLVLYGDFRFQKPIDAYRGSQSQFCTFAIFLER